MRCPNQEPCVPKATPLEPSDLVVDLDDPAVAVVTINRPKRRNALTFAMWRELGNIFDRLARQPELRAIILTGAGGAFSAGADISEFPAVRATAEAGHAYEAVVDACLTAVQSCPKATIAAVSGPCYGGGVGVALACDFRVADKSAYFAIPAARLSNVYGVIETRSLFNAVGLAVAKEVLFAGRRYDVDEAHAVGLATHRCQGNAMSGARDLAASLANSAPLTIKGAKLVLTAIAHAEIEKRHAAISRVMDEALSSDDYKEGVAAFAAKRDPVFRGR
jgi:enoyl-CoA hydratase/carnithine racemase